MIGFLNRLFARGEPALSEATPHDAAAIAALHGKSFHRGWTDSEIESLLVDRSVIAHRATVGPSLVGFILSRMAADEAEILSVAVAPARRGRGLSRRLLDLHLRRLAGIGMHRVFLEVDEDNMPARRLYARAGFRDVSRREAYSQDRPGRSAAALVLQGASRRRWAEMHFGQTNVRQEADAIGRWKSGPGRPSEPPGSECCVSRR